MEYYFDYAATTQVALEVTDGIKNLLNKVYGNPSSLHSKGVEAEKYIKSSRRMLAKILGGKENEIIFTSGGTESNNLAILGTIPQNRKGRLITSSIEHPSVLEVFKYLAGKGYDVVFLPVDANGVIQYDVFKEALTQDTLMVSVMHVNNEMGAIQPIEAMASEIKKFNTAHNSRILFHVDGVQAFGKYLIPKGIDLYSFSGHKIHGLKGAGGLFVKSGTSIRPLVYGGAQEFSIRPGTENIIGITALGIASELAYAKRKSSLTHLAEIQSKLETIFLKDGGCIINSKQGAPHILNVSFLGVKSEVMLHSLEMEGIYVSSGSACSSKKKTGSHVLKAIGLTDAQIDSAIRISYGSDTDIESAESVAHKMLEIAEKLRKIMRRA